MDGASAKKSTSFETLVIQNISNANDLRAKLFDIISAGKNYEYDVSECLKALIQSSDEVNVLLAVQAISELAKCEIKRESYAQKEIILPLLNMLDKELTTDKLELVKQCCRSLGNLCCDCDVSRNIILENNGVKILRKLLEGTLRNNSSNLNEIKLLVNKTLLNYGIGGQKYTESLVQEGVIQSQCKILVSEIIKNDMDDDMIHTALMLLSVINDNTPEILFDEDVNKAVLGVLKDTSNIEISELCLDHLHSQAEHDSVKTLIAKEGGVQLVCQRLQELVNGQKAKLLKADDPEVEAVMKEACDLIIIVLTGDEAMEILYKGGKGEVYRTVIDWLASTNQHLLATAILAVGNFARRDDYCTQMMKDNIYDQLLNIFETYHAIGLRLREDSSDAPHNFEPAAVVRVEHAALSALRNLSVPAANKRAAGARGRAAPLLLAALPALRDHHAAYSLLAALRMLVDGQDEVATLVAESPAALAAAARWGAAEHAGAAGEAPRLLAWTVRQAPRHAGKLVQVEGCVTSLVNMLLASHSVMQNEAVLALTLLSVETLNTAGDADCERTLIAQLIKSEIGKHISVLVETNCAKMPLEVAQNLTTFLNITTKVADLAADYKEAKVPEALLKFAEARKDLFEDLKSSIGDMVRKISDHGKSNG